MAEVWQQPYGGADKTVDVHLSWLRRKLGETAQQARYLHSVRGVGVRIAAPETSAPDVVVTMDGWGCSRTPCPSTVQGIRQITTNSILVIVQFMTFSPFRAL